MMRRSAAWTRPPPPASRCCAGGRGRARERMTDDTSTGSGQAFGELNVPSRLLLGPGPSNVHPRVYRAMMNPVIGYLDPQFLQLLDDTQRPLRALFRTENDMTIAIS